MAIPSLACWPPVVSEGTLEQMCSNSVRVVMIRVAGVTIEHYQKPIKVPTSQR